MFKQPPSSVDPVILYYSTSISDKYILNSAIPCKEKISKSIGYSDNRVFNFNMTFADTKAKDMCCYICIASCDLSCDENGGYNCQSDINIQLKLEIKNGNNETGVYISYDEQGLFVIGILFFMLNVFEYFWLVSIEYNLKALDKNHLTVKILNMSLLINIFGLGFFVIYYTYYSEEGKMYVYIYTFNKIIE